MKRLRLLVVGMTLVALTAVSSAQTGTPPAYKVPGLPDGHPDLQGTWTTQTLTPLQRPKRYAGREFLTEAEADELIKLLARDGVDPLATNIFGASDEERQKRVDATWTRPWTLEIPLMATDGKLYEYACHEGNYGLANILSGARYADREAARAGAASPAPPR